MRVRKYNNRYVAYIGNRRGCDGIVRPAIGLHGVWLQSFGFHQDMIVLAELTQGCIVFTVKGYGMDLYRRLVSGVRQSDSSLLIQVRNMRNHGKDFPIMRIPEKCLDGYGFSLNDALSIQGEDGRVTVERITKDIL